MKMTGRASVSGSNLADGHQPNILFQRKTSTLSDIFQQANGDLSGDQMHFLVIHDEPPKVFSAPSDALTSLPARAIRETMPRLRNRLTLNLVSEALSTFLLLFIGCGIVAQYVLPGGTMNSYLQVCLGWGLLVSLLVFATYHTSGGHMNPAVSFALFSLGKLPLGHFLLYSLVQTAGAFFGTALCFHVYKDIFFKFDGGIRSVAGPNGTGGIFCSFPPEHVSHYIAFVDQVVGTALLLFFISALIDPRNQVPKYLHPIGFGANIVMISSAYGMNAGAPINPARDLGPRLFLLLAGYGFETFSWHHFYFWIPIVAPFPGALLGAWLYQFTVGFHIPDAEKLELIEEKAREAASPGEQSGTEDSDQFGLRRRLTSIKE